MLRVRVFLTSRCVDFSIVFTSQSKARKRDGSVCLVLPFRLGRRFSLATLLPCYVIDSGACMRVYIWR